jgi:hypothetical protein
MNTVALAKAIRDKSDRFHAEYEANQDPASLDTYELLQVLARIVEGKPLSRAFGAPGDWGYGTPVGDALAAAPGHASDAACKLNLQDAANGLSSIFPGRAWAIFVFGSEQGELAHYTSNGPREKIVRAVTELRDATGFSALPTRDNREN